MKYGGLCDDVGVAPTSAQPSGPRAPTHLRFGEGADSKVPNKEACESAILLFEGLGCSKQLLCVAKGSHGALALPSRPLVRVAEGSNWKCGGGVACGSGVAGADSGICEIGKLLARK